MTERGRDTNPGIPEPQNPGIPRDRRNIEREAVVFVARGQVARACRELPPGSAVEQLRNFCGRTWEILHTPTQAALYRRWVTQAPRDTELARFYSEEVYRPIHSMMVEIIVRGVATRQFRAVAPQAAARVILAALIEQAFWCNHAEAFGPAVGGGCNRVTAETLSVLLGGLQQDIPGLRESGISGLGGESGSATQSGHCAAGPSRHSAIPLSHNSSSEEPTR